MRKWYIYDLIEDRGPIKSNCLKERMELYVWSISDKRYYTILQLCAGTDVHTNLPHGSYIS